MSDIHSDSRIAKTDGRRTRGSRAEADEARTNDMGTAYSLDEVRRMVRSEFVQEALPTIPAKPGWHRCWLSTTSPYDPIHKRIRLGYRPVRVEDVGMPGIETYRMTSGEFAGAVSCNEMVLFEIPEEVYQAIMQEYHHNMPLEEEQGIRAKTEEQNAEDRRGKKLMTFDEEDEGFQNLGRDRRAPSFD